MKRQKTLKTVIGAMALGSLALTGCASGDKAAEGGDESATQPAEGEGEAAGEGEGSCSGEGSCGG